MLLALSLTFQSCGDGEFESEFKDFPSQDLKSWQQLTEVNLAPVSNANFLVNEQIFTKELTWNTETVTFDGEVSSDRSDIEDFSKIDIYVSAQEASGYNFDAPYDNLKMKIATISSFTDEGAFSFSVTKDEMNAMFGSKFQNARTGAVELMEGDLFTFTYVLTHKNGSTLDSRNSPSVTSSFGVGVELVPLGPPDFSGEFLYEYIKVSPGAAPYVTLGSNGTWTGPTPIVDGTAMTGFSVFPNILINYRWGGGGTMLYDYSDNGITITDTSGYSTVWVIDNINGPSVDIDFTYVYASEFFTIRLTRTDGRDWPTDMHIK